MSAPRNWQNTHRMFSAGDIVRFHSTTASKEKFHLCLGEGVEGPKFAFLYLNSGSGFRGDCSFADGIVLGLPTSATGQTIVSFSQIVRIGEVNLKKYGATKTGQIDASIAATLADFARGTLVLTRAEREFVTAVMKTLCT